MGLLVGLPLKLFHIVFLLVRLIWPLLLIWLAVWAWRKLKRRGTAPGSPKREAEEPHFDGPVVDVDYQVVDEEEKP